MQTCWQSYELSEAEKQQLAFYNSQVFPVNIVKELPLQSVAEGLLFVVGEDGLNLEQLVISLACEPERVVKLLQQIATKYQDEQYGIELVCYADRYKFVSKQQVYPYARRLFQDAKPETLSGSALETLAIIAYKQPVTRVEIEELRGVGCEMMLRRLLGRNLIQEAGRSEAPGRPILYEVTAEFMDCFALQDLKDLPELPHYEENNPRSLYE